uniref:Uncharacterized protein n=1 Tax=Rhizophora mucronata TaxID=61149 RepID=A0A2P2LLG9_RHIMU
MLWSFQQHCNGFVENLSLLMVCGLPQALQFQPNSHQMILIRQIVPFHPS